MVTSNPDMIYVGTKVTSVLKFPSYQETLRWEIARYRVPKLMASQQFRGRAKLIHK
jgi:hypothetical protein